ncbi:hypothetical protein GGI25_000860 [Coemansia spiralis]|uniref:ER membrane protein complex subunit 7 beta-sandwich domain-containing protein n=2 Tax=Coemansia TaxID=4863 RepID=A0A9W8GBN9_9FUNG|nr:hypothetical protein BX070DRAFT_234039 [Coemansia spiralis]KAJ1994103.1 hypothetical protein EDC05_001773 [Coemansia umbellata]KAJ2623597.1 hypothetical protein GGI26_002235 [Coemansia sp. RSA 1358]KAJ2680267.1 hypothetical protein GGI25_000860 [Coemansia spiralis]
MLRQLLFIIQSALLLLAAVAVASPAKTYRVRGAIIANDVLGDISELSTRAQVVVNGGEHTGFIQKDGAFAVDNIKLGDSLLEVVSADYAFPKIHLRISLKEDGKASIAARYVQIGSEWPEDAPVLAYPLRISAAGKYDFFTPRQGFNIVAMFSNPYMMMVGASLVAIFILPKLQANMDPDALKGLQNKQK